MNEISKQIVECFKKGNKILICGNGGSMTQADHFAEELLGKFEKERKSLPAISLSHNSTISAIANDYGYELVFSRQIEGLGRPGDILITISTSGTSKNIIKAQNTAFKMGLKIIKFPTNKELGTSTYKTQELHLKLIHQICRQVENAFT